MRDGSGGCNGGGPAGLRLGRRRDRLSGPATADFRPLGTLWAAAGRLPQHDPHPLPLLIAENLELDAWPGPKRIQNVGQSDICRTRIPAQAGNQVLASKSGLLGGATGWTCRIRTAAAAVLAIVEYRAQCLLPRCPCEAAFVAVAKASPQPGSPRFLGTFHPLANLPLQPLQGD